MAGSWLPGIVGCTASGKTDLALALGRSRRLEVISADSRQIYRGMDIGTAKPTAEEMRRLPHHLVDVADPDEYYSAGRFAREALRAAEEIRERGAQPLVVGGTGLYMIALSGGLDDMPARNDRIRKGLRAAEEERPGTLRRMLLRLDSKRAMELGEADTVRHVRALEIVLQSGKRFTRLRGSARGPSADLRLAGLRVRLPVLRRRIAARARRMIDSGLADEVKALLGRGYGRDSALGRTIGYTEMLDVLDGLLDMEEAAERIEANTWKLARRQRNMFGRLSGVRWFSPSCAEAVESYLFSRGR